MKISKIIIALQASAFVLSIAPAALAQSGPASSASTDLDRAASSAGHAVSEAYHGTKRAVKDTAITAKVKPALHDDKLTKGSDIHVDTVGGVVTLSGAAPSTEAAQRAMQLAQQTTGVRVVKDAITIGPEHSSMR